MIMHMDQATAMILTQLIAYLHDQFSEQSCNIKGFWQFILNPALMHHKGLTTRLKNSSLEILQEGRKLPTIPSGSTMYSAMVFFNFLYIRKQLQNWMWLLLGLGKQVLALLVQDLQSFCI